MIVFSSWLPAQNPNPSIQPPQLIMLGTGTPAPDPSRSGPAAAVVFGGVSYLVDCGPGIVRRCTLAAGTRTIPALQARNLTRVFITHLHSDHTVGYPDLILTPWVVGRASPLEAYGPRGLGRMTRSILDAYHEDIDIRIHGLEQESPAGLKVNVHEVRPGQIYRNSEVVVSAFKVKHGAWKEAYGYRFDVGGKVIVFSGDTAPCATLETAAAGADILVHEAYSEEELTPEKRPGGGQWPQYMREFHTSAQELGAIAQRVQPKLLVISHIVRRKATDQDIIDQVRAGGFLGPVVVAKDLDIF